MEPIVIVTHKLGICRVDPAGKPCKTSFTRLTYNKQEDTSILKCARGLVSIATYSVCLFF